MNTRINTAISALMLLVAFFLLSSFCRLDECNDNSIVGKWAAVTTEEYNSSNVLQSKETPQGSYWEISEKTITVRDKNDERDGVPLSYSMKDKTIILDKLSLTYTVRELTESKLVVQSSQLGDMYVVITFKKVK